MALKGMEPAPNPQRRGGSKKLEGGSFKVVIAYQQSPNMKRNDSTVQGKTKHTPT